MEPAAILYRVRIRDSDRTEWVMVWAGSRARVDEIHDAAMVAARARGMADAVPDLIEYERKG